jgi:hypothetical protein
MLAALRRELIRHEYWAQAPATTSTPQITPGPVTDSPRRRLKPESRDTLAQRFDPRPRDRSSRAEQKRVGSE